jgi:predicted GNAT family acetyltransferase
MEMTILNNEAESRFETIVEGHLALVEYERSPGRIAFTHTEVPPALEGRGVASALAKHVLQFARDNQLKVIPLCPFISGYIRKHRADYADILAPGYEGI